jgi:hypothetical protein
LAERIESRLLLALERAVEFVQRRLDCLCRLDHHVKPHLDRFESADRRLWLAVRAGCLENRNGPSVCFGEFVEPALLRVRRTYRGRDQDDGLPCDPPLDICDWAGAARAG